MATDAEVPDGYLRDQEEMRKILFKDTEGGVRYDIRALESKKVSWKALSCVVGLVIALSGALYGYQAKAKNALADTYLEMVKTNTDNIAGNSEAMHIICTQQLGLSTDITWIKRALQRIEKTNGFAVVKPGR